MNQLKKIISALVCTLVGLYGCGGGTRGTGGLTVEGRVITVQGAPIQTATVTSLETGDQATTDTTGGFILVTDQIVGEPHFLIETQNLQVTSSGGTIPPNASVVSVEIVVQTQGKPSATQKISTKRERPNNSSSSSSSASSASSQNSSASAGSSSSSPSASSSSSSSSSSSDDDDEHSSSSSSANSSSSSSSDEQHDRVEVEGLIQGISGATVTVQGRTFTVNGQTDFGNRDSLSDFSVGEKVEARGEFVNGVLIAQRIRLKN